MRSSLWILGLFALLGLTGKAAAQGSASTILGGPSPASIVSKPIDTSNVISKFPAQAAQQNRFNFTSLFSKMSMPSFPVKRGVSPQPIPSTFPSSNYAPFKMVGKPPVTIGDPKLSKSLMKVPTPFSPSQQTPVGPGSGS